MKHPLLLWFLFMTVFLMGVVHLVALELSLYWYFPALDIPMHVLGGAVSAFAVLLLTLHIPRFTRYQGVVPVLLGVLIIGLLWEWFEIWAGIPLTEPGFLEDTLLDLCMDICGGMLGYFIGTKITSI